MKRARSIAAVRARWQDLLDRIDATFPSLQDRSTVASWKTELKAPLEEIFGGHAFAPVLARMQRRSSARTCAAACSSRCTCTPATATCTRTCRSIPTTTRCCSEANAAVARIMALARSLGGVDLGRARHRHHQARVPDRGRARALRRLQARASTRTAGSTRGKLLRRRGPRLRAYTPSFSLIGAREPDPRSLAHRRSRRLDQGLPALRQVQAGVRDARAAREPALLAAQQDPRHVAPDRGVPVRGADAARRVACGTSTSSPTSPTTARSATSAKPRARSTSTSATCRSRCATSLRKRGQAAVSARRRRRRCSSSTRPTRRRSRLAQARDDRLGLSRAASRARRREAPRADVRGRRSTRRRRIGTRAAQGAGHPLHQQADAGRLAEAHVARAPRHRGRRDRSDHPQSAKRGRGRRRGVLFPGLRLGAAVLAGRASRRRRCSSTSARRRCCRRATCAAAIRRRRRATTSAGSRSSPTTACCSTASPTRSTISTSRR